jgi:decaprenylphospho-beta-D-ribofuranose 2-oxidase
LRRVKTRDGLELGETAGREVLDQLDEVVLGHGGRLYLSKDSRMKPEIFLNGYPRVKEFLQIINQYNPNFKVKSDLSDRLSISKASLMV